MPPTEKLKCSGGNYALPLTVTLDVNLPGTVKGAITMHLRTLTTYEAGKVSDFTITGISWQCAIITTDLLKQTGAMRFAGDT